MKIEPQKINLLKTSLIISLTGIFILLLLSNILEPKLTNIEQINEKMLNRKVKVQGEIFNIRVHEDSDFQIISIKDETGKIDITTDKILNLTNNQEITVVGSIQEYKEFLQIRADKILLR
jgi:DNA/RNA endonuclease YhcR with UshA esterase domain